ISVHPAARSTTAPPTSSRKWSPR
ncbi:TPA_asm: UL12 uoORF, partial [Human alphaherpesvirus 1]